LSVLIGIMRGFGKEFLSLLKWGGAAAFAYYILPLARELIHPYIPNPMIADLTGLFCLFIIALIVLSIIANMITDNIHNSSFKGIDHSLGFGFGVVRGVVVLTAMEILLSMFSPRLNQSPMIQTSRFIPMVRRGADTLMHVLPASLQNYIITYTHKVESQINAKLHDQLKTQLPGHESQFFQGNNHPKNNDLPLGTQPGSQDYSSLTNSLLPDGSQEENSSPSVIVAPSAQGQAPQLKMAPGTASETDATQPNQPNAAALHSVPGSLSNPSSPSPSGQQDQQTVVDELASLKPRQAEPAEDSGYTSPQQNDLNRLVQTTNGK
jgi:membrane protein required for colicin V production